MWDHLDYLENEGKAIIFYASTRVLIPYVLCQKLLARFQLVHLGQSRKYEIYESASACCMNVFDTDYYYDRYKTFQDLNINELFEAVRVDMWYLNFPDELKKMEHHNPW